MKRKVVFCVPTVKAPYPEFVEALERSIAPVIAAGWEEGTVSEVGNPYISNARNSMLRKALDARADVIVFLDHDLSWDEHALLKLLETDGDVVCATYRYKTDEERYMGQFFSGANGTPIVRADGCIHAEMAPAGFLKVTNQAVNAMMTHYPELCYGPRYSPFFDMFSHGAHNGLWWGEDYAFCRRWNDMGRSIWLIPDLNITHYRADGIPFPGNLHNFLRRQAGGDLSFGAKAA